MNQSEWDGSPTDLEERASIASLEGLHQKRRVLVEQNAGLIARYGNFGHHDDFRKQRLEAQKIKARMDATERGEKYTDKSVEAEAYGSPEYADFLDRALAEKIEYLTIQNRIDEINEQIRGRELALLAYNAEARLSR